MNNATYISKRLHSQVKGKNSRLQIKGDFGRLIAELDKQNQSLDGLISFLEEYNLQLDEMAGVK